MRRMGGKSMKTLQANSTQTINSREAAEMVEKRHSDLIRDIEIYVAYIDQNADLRSDDFFKESRYQSGTGKNYKCYELTKQGCEMVANKLTGKKGIQFTAFYVQKFNQMEQNSRFNLPANFKEALLQLAGEVEQNEQLQLENNKKDQIIGELKPKADHLDCILKSKSLLTITQIAKDYGMSGNAMNKLLHELGVQYKQSGQWLLYQKYHATGYTHSETIDIIRTDGKHDVTMNTKWTQKGRLFIYELLKNQYNLLPLIEQETIPELKLVKQ